MADFDFNPSAFARDFVAENESERQPGRIGDRGNAVGIHQFDRRSGFKGFYRGLPKSEQQAIFPEGPDPAIFDSGPGGRPFNTAEQKQLTGWFTSPAGQVYESAYFAKEYEAPAYFMSMAHSPEPGGPPDKLQALMLDMVTQRGKSKVEGLLAGQGHLTPGQLVDLEVLDLPALARKGPMGAADILFRRVGGAHKLDVNINPTHVYRAIAEVVQSPKWDDMRPRDQKQTMSKLRATLQQTMDRYHQDRRGNINRLNTLRDMLGLERDLKQDLESFAGGLDWSE